MKDEFFGPDYDDDAAGGGEIADDGDRSSEDLAFPSPSDPEEFEREDDEPESSFEDVAEEEDLFSDDENEVRDEFMLAEEDEDGEDDPESYPPAFAPYTRGDWSDIAETESDSDSESAVTAETTAVQTDDLFLSDEDEDEDEDDFQTSLEESEPAEKEEIPSPAQTEEIPEEEIPERFEQSEGQAKPFSFEPLEKNIFEESDEIFDLAQSGATLQETEKPFEPETEENEELTSEKPDSAPEAEETEESEESAKKEEDKEEKDRSVSSDLIRGHINTIILRSLYDGDKYGYEIITEIERKSHNQYSLKQPSLYSALKRLEKDGYVTSYWGGSVTGGRRKYFSLTDEGKEISERNQTEWEYSRTVIDSLISDREYDFASEKAPSAVDMRMLLRSTSRTPGKGEGNDEEDFEYEAPDEIRTESEKQTATVAEKTSELSEVERERAAFEAEQAMREEALRQREEALRLREEAGAKREQELLEREFALQTQTARREEEEEKARQEEERLRLQAEEEEKARQEEERLRLQAEEEEKARQEEERLRLQAEEEEKARQEEERLRREEEERMRTVAEEAERSVAEMSERLHAEEEEKERLAQEHERLIAEAEEAARQEERERVLAEVEERQRQLWEEQQEKERLAQEHERLIAEAQEAARQEERERVLAEVEEQRKQEEEARRQAEAEQARRQAEEEVAWLKAEAAARERQIAEQNNEIERTRAMALNADKTAQNERIIHMEPFAEERAQYEDRLRRQAEEFERFHAREIAQTEKRVREEDEERFRQREHQMIHQNYLNLVRGVKSEEQASEETASYYYAPARESESYVYGAKPEKEREYRSAIQRLFYATIHDEEEQVPPPPAPEERMELPSPPLPAPPPPPAPEIEKTEKSRDKKPRTARALDGIDFYDLESRAAQDGIRVSLAGGRKAKALGGKSESLVHKGRALFLSALVVFLLCLAEGSLTLGFRSRFNFPILYPFLIWGAGLAVLFVTGLMFINRYGERALRQTGNLMVNIIVSYALCVIVILITALARQIDFTNLNELMTSVIVPAIFCFNIIVFGVAYFLQIRPINDD